MGDEDEPKKPDLNRAVFAGFYTDSPHVTESLRTNVYRHLVEFENERRALPANGPGRGRVTALGKLRAEIEALANQARMAAEAHRRRARTWDRLHLVFGLPGAILAAVAGTTALVSTGGRIAAGVLALGAAALAAGATFLDCDAKATHSQRSAAALSTVATDAQILATHGIEDDEVGQIRRSLRSLVDRLEAIHVGDLTTAEVLKTLERERPES